MRRADQVAAIFLLALSVWFAGVAIMQYTYWGPAGPASGFLPVWLSVAMAVLAVVLLAQATRAPGPGPAWLPDRRGLVRLLVVVAATAAFIALMQVVGMMLGTALFLLLLLRGLERYSWPLAAGVAAGTAAVNYLVFTYWLRVPFPVSALGF